MARPMTIHDVPHIAAHLLAQHGLASLGWRFGWDNARRRAGCCRYRQKLVSLSRHYVALNVVERPDDVVDTILHEIAHALTFNRHGGAVDAHGAEWKAEAARIGARPERCYDSSVIAMPPGRWQATCGLCKRTFRRHRPLPAGMWNYCRACGPDAGRLLYVDTAGSAPAAVDAPTPKKLR